MNCLKSSVIFNKLWKKKKIICVTIPTCKSSYLQNLTLKGRSQGKEVQCFIKETEKKNEKAAFLNKRESMQSAYFTLLNGY